MEAMRQDWTDDRLDAFRTEVNVRFDSSDRRFVEIDRRLGRVEDRLDALNETIVKGFIGLASLQVASTAAMVGLVALIH